MTVTGSSFPDPFLFPISSPGSGGGAGKGNGYPALSCVLFIYYLSRKITDLS